MGNRNSNSVVQSLHITAFDFGLDVKDNLFLALRRLEFSTPKFTTPTLGILSLCCDKRLWILLSSCFRFYPCILRKSQSWYTKFNIQLLGVVVTSSSKKVRSNSDNFDICIQALTPIGREKFNPLWRSYTHKSNAIVIFLHSRSEHEKLRRKKVFQSSYDEFNGPKCMWNIFVYTVFVYI